MGVFKRPDSPYWWLYLETTKQRERTPILLGDTISQRADAKRLAERRLSAADAGTRRAEGANGCPTARR